MARPLKINEVPVAPFNLRVTGPLHVDEIARRLGNKSVRIAQSAKIDPRATIDPDPCPVCAAQVEWASTSKRNPAGGMIERYVYARCRGKVTHRWDFRHVGASVVVPPTPPVPRGEIPPPGTGALAEWLDQQIEHLSRQLEKIQTIRKLASEVRMAPVPENPRPSVH